MQCVNDTALSTFIKGYHDLLTWASKNKYTEIVNKLSLKDKTYFGDSKFEIVTTVKLNHIMEKLDVIINDLLKKEVED